MSKAYLAVCWSVAQQMNRASRDTRVHVQGHDSGKTGRTLCGVLIAERWDYDVWLLDEYGQIEGTSGCIRCRRILERQSESGGGTVKRRRSRQRSKIPVKLRNLL